MVERFFQLEHYVWLLLLFTQKHHLRQKQQFLRRLEHYGIDVRPDCLIDTKDHIIVQRYDKD